MREAAIALEVVALTLFVLAAAGVVHQRFQLVPAGLALVVLAHLLRLAPT